jgi:hypothetical protein
MAKEIKIGKIEKAEILKLKAHLETLGKNCVMFVGFEYKDKEGEVSKRVVNIGTSYLNALVKDLETVSIQRFDDLLTEEARIAILKSKIMSIKKIDEIDAETELALNEAIQANNLTFTEKEVSTHAKRSDAQINAYIEICTGLKYCENTKLLYISGTSVKKTIIEAVVKTDTRKPLTVAKDSIRKDLKADKFRNFIRESLQGGFNVKGDTLFLNGVEEEAEGAE